VKIKEISTKEITLKVKSLLPENTKDILDIKPLEKPAFNKNIIYLAIIIILIISAIILVIYLFKKRSRLNSRETISPPLPPHIEAENLLKELEYSNLLKEGNYKKYYYILSEIFKKYLERRFNLQAVEKTTEEILKSLSSLNADKEAKEEIRKFFFKSDPIKFAEEMVSTDDAKQDTENVRNFIRITKSDDKPQGKEASDVAVR